MTKTCRRGHDYDAARKQCPTCQRMVRARYDLSEKGQARDVRYRARSDNHTKRNKRRIWIGKHYVGLAQDARKAVAINRYARRRLDEFKQGQSARTQVESIPTRAIPPEAEP